MKKQIILACLCAVVLLGLFIQPTSATNDPLEVVSVDRTVHITYHKVFQVMDKYTFINTGNDPISSLIIAVPYQYDSNIASFEVFGSDSNTLTFKRLPYDGSNFLKWRVYLDTPLYGKETFFLQNNITFVYLTSDISSSTDGTQGHINFNFFKYPTSPYYIQNCSVKFTCAPKVTIYDPIQYRYATSLTIASNIPVSRNNITAYNSRYNMTAPTGFHTFALASYKFPYINREIQVDLWGFLHISEEHLIEHIGPDGNFRINSFPIEIPLDALDLYIYDKFGKLSYTRSKDNPRIVTLNYAATRYALQKGESTTYWITYRLPLQNYGQINGDRLRLKFDIFFGNYHGVIENFAISLIIPKDASLISQNPSIDLINTQGNNLYLFYNESTTTDYNTKIVELNIDITNSLFHFLARPILFLIIIVAICSSYVVAKRMLPSEERLFERITVVPTPIILEFCSLFEEKTSLVSELEKLDEDLKNRKIKKRIYRNQRKTAEKKILELNKDIEDLKINLRNAGGRFAQIANELEINEAERESAKDGLFNLEQRYLRKKISVVAYQKLSNDLENRHKKAKTKIDKLLFELRDILS